VNFVLCKRNKKLDSLENAFGDGIVLKDLLEILSKKEIPNLNKKCAMRVQKISNVGIVFNFMQEIEKIKFVNIQPEDIVDNKMKLIFALIWVLIQNYVIESVDLDDEDEKEVEDLQEEDPQTPRKRFYLGDAKTLSKQEKTRLILLNWLDKQIGNYDGVSIDQNKTLKQWYRNIFSKQKQIYQF
jgi:hypothetical protein